MNTPAELVETAHQRQLAMRFEVSALEAALAAGYTNPLGQYAYALTWLAEYAAGRVLELSADAARAHDAADPAAPKSPQSAGRGRVHAVKPSILPGEPDEVY
jgi:hypothetical protein